MDDSAGGASVVVADSTALAVLLPSTGLAVLVLKVEEASGGTPVSVLLGAGAGAGVSVPVAGGTVSVGEVTTGTVVGSEAGGAGAEVSVAAGTTGMVSVAPTRVVDAKVIVVLVSPP